ncbi:MAG TPA: DNA polymerase III subunit gamma/tau [Anaerolineae bacterium]|nr:DNA polymerase III subunit gamma/tau [Anaerolineae bacterium]
MPAKALYLKYRPQTFEDVQGQEHITNTLKNALVLNRIAHAYLFTGTRGTGKTSTARILAKAVNCLNPDVTKRPDNECAICRAINEERLLDLVEIDAASNTGVDNIRDLRDKVDFRPNEARFKVYIIDEAHMLSNAAFNALLKTLEEPPPHVIFVLATTEANRVPATITSRCQRFDFKRATLQELIQQLGDIAKKEGMELEPAALELVARQANGSFRDGTSLLDQLTAYSGDTITLKHVQVLLGAASREIIRDIVAALAAREVGQGIAALDQAVDAGADPRQVARDVVEYLRGVLMFTVKSDVTLSVADEVRAEMREIAAQMNPEQVSRAIRLFSQAGYDLRNSASPTLPLEMALVEATIEPASAMAAAPTRTVRPPAAPADNAFVPTPARSVAPGAAAAKVTKAEPVSPRASAAKKNSATRASGSEDSKENSGALSIPATKENWNNIIARFQRVNKTMAAFLRDAEPVSLKSDLLTIGFFYDFHQQRFDNDKNAKGQLEKILQEMFGETVRVKCIVSPKRAKMQAAQDDPVIRAAMNLGGKIVDLEEDEE